MADIKTISQELQGNSFMVKKEVIETLTEQDLIQRKNQLSFQQSQIKLQMQQLKDAYDQATADIADCDNMLKQFNTIPTLDSTTN